MRDKSYYLIYMENNDENSTKNSNERLESHQDSTGNSSSSKNDEESEWHLYQNKKNRFLSHFL
jgi:hypothetical protein